MGLDIKDTLRDFLHMHIHILVFVLQIQGAAQCFQELYGDSSYVGFMKPKCHGVWVEGQFNKRMFLLEIA